MRRYNEKDGTDGMDGEGDAGGGTGMMKELRTKIGDGAGDRRGERLDSFIKSLGQSPSRFPALPANLTINALVVRGEARSSLGGCYR